MQPPLVVRGHYTGQTFVPDGPLPVAEGTAELIITPKPVKAGHSAFEAVGKALHPRTREDIDAQIAEERAGWDDR